MGVRLIFVRHGSQMSTTVRPPGEMHDPHLSAKGMAEAAATAEQIAEMARVAGATVGAVFSSPMRRALHTARRIADAIQAPLQVWGDCYEFSASQQRQRSAEAIALDAPLRPLVCARGFGRDGEWLGKEVNFEMLRSRCGSVKRALEDVLTAELASDGERFVILVAHQTFLDCLAQMFLDEKLEFRYGFPKYKIPRAGLLAIAVEGAGAYYHI